MCDCGTLYVVIQITNVDRSTSLSQKQKGDPQRAKAAMFAVNGPSGPTQRNERRVKTPTEAEADRRREDDKAQRRRQQFFETREPLQAKAASVDERKDSSGWDSFRRHLTLPCATHGPYKEPQLMQRRIFSRSVGICDCVLYQAVIADTRIDRNGSQGCHIVFNGRTGKVSS